MSAAPKVRTCLWFEKNGLEAARFYVSLLPDSRLEKDYAAGADPLTVEFRLAGAPYQILHGGPHYKLSPAASISVATEDQAETDRLWNALVADGGAESMCGWLVDRFGVSWQIVPRQLIRMLTDRDRKAAARAQEAMMKMKKIDIAAMETAFNGN